MFLVKCAINLDDFLQKKCSCALESYTALDEFASKYDEQEPFFSEHIQIRYSFENLKNTTYKFLYVLVVHCVRFFIHQIL